MKKVRSVRFFVIVALLISLAVLSYAVLRPRISPIRSPIIKPAIKPVPTSNFRPPRIPSAAIPRLRSTTYKESTLYGNPLTPQEKSTMVFNLMTVSNQVVPSNAPVVPMPALSERADLSYLILKAFPVNDRGAGLGWGILEPDLINVATSGTASNRAYNLSLRTFDNIINKLNAVRSIANRYEGIGNSSKAVWLEFLDEYIQYFREYRTWAVNVHNWASTTVRSDDGISHYNASDSPNTLLATFSSIAAAFKDLSAKVSNL